MNKRKNSEILQRTTRQKLAILLNRPNDVPAELIMPELMFLDKKAPDAIEYYQRSLAVNPQILLMRETVKAKRSAVLAKKNSALPVISALLEVNEYERELDSRNKVEIGLQLTLPIYQSGLHTAKKAQAIADLQLSAAQLTLAEQRLQQDILELALYLDELSIRKQSVAQQLDYRELEMDKHRVEYELEIQTNMSSAGARMSLAQWQAAEIDFQIELAWKKLNALMGQAPDTAPKELQQ